LRRVLEKKKDEQLMQDGNPSHVDVAARVGKFAVVEDVWLEIAVVGLLVSKHQYM